MQEKKPSRYTTLGIIALVVLVGIMCWFKRSKKQKRSNSTKIGERKTSDGANNDTGWWSPVANVVFVFITLVILIGAFLYVIASYPIPSLTSTGNFKATVSDNQTITGTFGIQNLDGKTNTGDSGSNFDLAIVSGVLGGFALTLMVTRRRQYPNHLQASLLLQGVFYILATVSFIVFGFYLAADKARLLENFKALVPVYVASFYVGTLSLGIGIAFSLWALIRLLIRNWKSFWNQINQAISGR